MQVVYLEPCDVHDPPPPFRVGEAGRVWIGEGGGLESESKVLLSANATHALLGHGVIDRLNDLELEGRLGSGREVMIPPSCTEAVLGVLYRADRKTYGNAFDFVVDRRNAEPAVEYRVRIDNREYQRALSRLQFLVSSAGREGAMVWIRI